MVINSVPFPGPFVRIRGHVREGGRVVEWSSGLRSFRRPRGRIIRPPVVDDEFDRFHLHRPQRFDGWWLVVLDAASRELCRVRVNPVTDSTATGPLVFTEHVPFQENAAYVALHHDQIQVGGYAIDRTHPVFTLTTPVERPDVAGVGPMLVKWRAQTAAALTYHARYTPDGQRWFRFASNLRSEQLVAPLDAMQPGPASCIQILGTNGYHTSFVETAVLG